MNGDSGIPIGLGSSGEFTDDREAADVLVAFVRGSDAVDAARDDIARALRRDAAVWLAYPKSHQLGSDLSRDSIHSALAELNCKPVRQVTLDAVWTAVRFRSLEFIKPRGTWP
ncbi:MAG: hypothetical protein KY395_06710 [Actinobacteria bacterium]|nr:hypothetical protein [Actinomycetota bacterium]